MSEAPVPRKSRDIAKVIFLITLSLLAVIIIFSCAVLSMLSKESDQIGNIITDIMDDSEKGNWTKAQSQVSSLKDIWSDTEKKWAMLLDHLEIDNIDMALQRVSTLIDRKQKELAITEASVLLLYIKHIPEKETFNLVNLL